ncbi:glycosyltransferase family A protein [Cytophagaceae bacterium YF14B1]|uniref:Glycosyltransferase family A protein n=1 Tax=Xanthocytophaga flava TaxID=3048013 RepID=A0AAE3QKP5_9BACT|nr:glycosyltransferase family A protein [Xanthocytophaga flavus]MDJ1480705.1 glycosyltransferase family A protein [Xanthocytophaga flavus]
MFSFIYSRKDCTSEKNVADVTIVLNIWKRRYLKEQLESLYRQTILPKNIWILQCEEHTSIKKTIKKFPNIQYIHSSQDLKYFGRFSIANHIDTCYTWILDDDIIPSSSWIETCISSCSKYNAIICCNGRFIDKNDYTPEIAKWPGYLQTHFIGDARYPLGYNYCPKDTFVDYGCSSFFFKTEWIRHFWSIWPITFQTGEDIHLSATCMIRAGIPTVIPCQFSENDSGNITPAYSHDKHASWMREEFIPQRTMVLQYLINKGGWNPIYWKEPTPIIT